ncbi:MAG TPA: ATP-grasp domain-containing protein [Clostridiaceae bacterium]|nr:ATP-grasp domain-containing protein [Clostridiaceae bacterium]
MKKVMMIAGGTFQVPLCKRIKNMGHELVVVNPFADSPSFEYADQTIQMDVLHKEAILEEAKKLDIDAVVTDQTDISVETTAFIADRLNLPGLPLDKVELFTNKFAMREFSRQHGFPFPQYACCNHIGEAKAFFRSCQQKIIIKPCNAQSSRGIFIIENEEQLDQHFTASLQAAHGNHPYVVAEQFIEGTEFTVDGIIFNGKHHTLAISQKKHFSYNETIASELFFTKQNDEFDYAALTIQHDRMMNLTGTPFALTHTEYKYEDGKFVLIEMAARGGGTLIASHVVPLLSGVDTYRLLVEQALGETSAADSFAVTTPEDRAVVLKFFDVDQFQFPLGGVVSAIRGVEEMCSKPWVVELNLEFKVGTKLNRASDDRSRIGYYIAYADDPSTLRLRMSTLENSIKVDFEPR